MRMSASRVPTYGTCLKSKLTLMILYHANASVIPCLGITNIVKCSIYCVVQTLGSVMLNAAATSVVLYKLVASTERG